jgi:hypothetical protein
LNPPLFTDKTVPFNRPDITLPDKTNEESAFTEYAIPLTHNLQATVAETQSKYQNLAFEIKQLGQLNKIIVTPLVLYAAGVTRNVLNQSLTNLGLQSLLLSQLQKVVILNTCSIVRKFFNDLSDEEVDNP